MSFRQVLRMRVFSIKGEELKLRISGPAKGGVYRS